MAEAADRAYLTTLAVTIPLLHCRYAAAPGTTYSALGAELGDVMRGGRPWMVAARAAHAAVQGTLAPFGAAELHLLGAVEAPPAPPAHTRMGDAPPRLEARLRDYAFDPPVLPLLGVLALPADTSSSLSGVAGRYLGRDLADWAGARAFVALWRGADDLDRARLASCAGQSPGCLALAMAPSLDGDPEEATGTFVAAGRRLAGMELAGVSRARTCSPCGQSLAGLSARVREAHFASCGSSTGRPGTHAFHAPHRAVAEMLQCCLRGDGFDAQPELDGVLPGSQERPADVAVMEAPAAFHVAAPGCFLAIDVRVARVQTHSTLAGEVALPGAEVERIELAKRGQYEARVRAEGGRFTPFVLDEFGKLGPSATWFLHIMALKAADRQRTDFRKGRTLADRAARIRMRWAASIAAVLHTTIGAGQHHRLLASLRASGPAPDVG